jgi:hypothetical protein
VAAHRLKKKAALTIFDYVSSGSVFSDVSFSVTRWNVRVGSFYLISTHSQFILLAPTKGTVYMAAKSCEATVSGESLGGAESKHICGIIQRNSGRWTQFHKTIFQN